ncbi:MAG: phytanoyl-CoA dioxygenase family protein, partial [Pseudomonadales bacterium]
SEILALLGPTGRHGFEGFKTQRIYSLLQKTLLCNPLVEHPHVLGLLDRLLLPNYLLSQAVAINILPGEAQQLVHHDDAFYLVPRPRKALSVAAMWALDQFTAANGGTFVIPGSHRWEDRKPTEEDLKAAISVEMPAGSVCVFLGTLWHSGGANTSQHSRLGVTTQYCEPWCRTVENSFLSVPVESVKQCSPTLQQMLGYSLHGPFMGYVDDAQHPKRRF